MTRYFFDTSALVKRYHAEPGTQAVEAMFVEPRAMFVVSRLAVVECVSAFCLKVRSGELDASELPVMRRSLMGDVKQRELQVSRILVRHFSLAEQLLVRHGPTQRLRALDAIQIAVALHLLQNQQIDVFVSSDIVQCAVARLEGLRAINPVAPAPS